MTDQTPLHQTIWVEKYRPKVFEDVIVEKKSLITNYLKNSSNIPSFLFSSARAGTGKTTVAKVIVNYLKCDVLTLNASDERGIDTVRDKIKVFAESMSSLEGMKRCVFMDESDKMTSAAQDALRNIIETYSENCFFVFTCNDLSKIIEPIRSRCVHVNFDKPDKNEILARLQYICEKEDITDITEHDLIRLINFNYPDIRSMIVKLQNYKIDGQNLFTDTNEFEIFAKKIKAGDVKGIYETVYQGQFNILEFNKWYFQQIFERYELLGLDKAAKLATYLADIEKYWASGSNLTIIFLNAMLQIINNKLLG
jgi:replication factor C small subunit